MRPPEIATLEKPPPSPLAFQASGWPASGHFVSNPDSWATSSRLGPRHWGHSGDAAGAAKATDVIRMRARAAAGRGESWSIPDLLFFPSYREPAWRGRKFSVTAGGGERRYFPFVGVVAGRVTVIRSVLRAPVGAKVRALPLTVGWGPSSGSSSAVTLSAVKVASAPRKGRVIVTGEGAAA